MVVLAQLVRASDCGSEGRGFEPHIPPITENKAAEKRPFHFYADMIDSTANHNAFWQIISMH